MDLSIIILNYKTRGLLKQILKVILNFNLDIDWEIIVVDNASQDGSVEMVKEEFPKVKMITSPDNIGHAGGINLGIKETKGEFLLLLNTDIAIEQKSVESMHQFMEDNPDIGLAGPRLINPDGSIQHSCRKFPQIKTIIYRRTPLGKLPFAQKRVREFLMYDWDHQENRPVDWILGACMIVKSKALEEVGMMDERFFLYFEDVDWCRRFWLARKKVYYIAQVELVHYHRRESAVNPGVKGIFGYVTRIHIKSSLKYFLKYRGQKEPEIE